MPKVSLTIAVLQPFDLIFSVRDAPSSWSVPWDELPKVEVRAETSETIREALRRAGRLLGVAMTPMFVDTQQQVEEEEGIEPGTRSVDPADQLIYLLLRDAGDDEVVAVHDPEFPVRGRDARLWSEVAVVPDDRGRATWRRPALDATLGELLNAADQGLVDGDPLQPYLIPSIPQGDLGVLTEWISFTHVMTVAGVIATVDGVLGMGDRLRELRRRRTPDLQTIVERHQTDWAARGAAPTDLIRLLASAERTTAEISALLGCSEEDATAILWGFGFTLDSATKRWCRAGDSAGRLIADDIEIGFSDRVTVVGDLNAYRRLLEARQEAFLADGVVPSLEQAVRVLQRERSG